MTEERDTLKAVAHALVGGIIALAAVWLLYGARPPMFPSPRAYYEVGSKRFDWFSKSGPNCWGGHTLDGRCITAVFVFRASDSNRRPSLNP